MVVYGVSVVFLSCGLTLGSVDPKVGAFILK